MANTVYSNETKAALLDAVEAHEAGESSESIAAAAKRLGITTGYAYSLTKGDRAELHAAREACNRQNLAAKFGAEIAAAPTQKKAKQGRPKSLALDVVEMETRIRDLERLTAVYKDILKDHGIPV